VDECSDVVWCCLGHDGNPQRIHIQRCRHPGNE
jgi:hypothetical protein